MDYRPMVGARPRLEDREVQPDSRRWAELSGGGA
jgi:hypothetical protein